MASGRHVRAAATAIGIALLGAVPLAGDDDPLGLHVRQGLATRGVRVEFEARPLCRLAGEDADSKAGAVRFMTEFGIIVANAVADLDIPGSFTLWQAELRVVDHPAPSSDEAAGVRIIKSSPSLDLALMRALLQAKTPGLPNFRARCTFEITVQNDRRE
jgi:hypothetical protein